VSPINYSDLLLVVHPSVPSKDLKEFIAYAKSRPGALNYASSGPGTPYHFAAAVFCHRAGIEVQHVPFRQSGDARNAVVAGQVHIMFDGIATMLPLIRADRVRVLATTGPERSPILPEAPTLAETLPGLEMGGFVGVLAPAGTPGPVVERLNAEFNRLLRQDSARDAFRRLGSEPAPATLEEFAALLHADIARRREDVRLAGMLPG
jgi:tripartite-type tricarboxylate transporter receptor subunit TctC